MNMEQIKIFLSNNGLSPLFDEKGNLVEINEMNTNKKLNTKILGTSYTSEDNELDIFIYNKTVCISRLNTIIYRGNEFLSIEDKNTHSKIMIQFVPKNLYRTSNDSEVLGLIALSLMDKTNNNRGFDLIQSSQRAYTKGSKENTFGNIELENENYEKYIETILNGIKDVDYIGQNPNIRNNENIIKLTLQEFVKRIADLKKQYDDKLVHKSKLK